LAKGRAYACQKRSVLQTTVGGDPFTGQRQNSEEMHQDLARRSSKSVEWSFLRLDNQNSRRENPPGM